MHSALLVVSIDTEEDNWYRSRSNVTCENIGELERLSTFCERLGVRPTFFTSYQVAGDPRAAELVRQAAERTGGEIGAHLHPWNTPPLTEAFTPRNSMLKNLPATLQRQKLQTLTARLEETFGQRPASFRAGRYGFGRETVRVLLDCGYQIDSSITPFVSWEEFDDGPSFVGAPLDVYRLAVDQDVTQPAEDGELLEVPLSCGFSRKPFTLWGHVHRALDVPGLRRLRGVCKRTVLSPELASADDMLRLSSRLLERGVRHLHLTFHSPTLRPGLSPFAATAKDVARLYATTSDYIDRLARIASITFATVRETAVAELAPC